MSKAYLILGGNMGDMFINLSNARQFIEEKAGTVVQCSSIYKTAAWGKTDEPAFLNQVLLIETALPASSLIKIILDIELKMGRQRTIKNASRIIDIDILFYNLDIIHTHNLVVPHPEIPNRRFVLTPLNEIAPNLIHPQLNLSVSELLKQCTDHLTVDKL